MVEFIGMILTQDSSEAKHAPGPLIDPGFTARFARAHEAAGFDRVLREVARAFDGAGLNWAGSHDGEGQKTNGQIRRLGIGRDRRTIRKPGAVGTHELFVFGRL